MTEEATAMRPWRFVVRFGMVSLLADFVYEGARSVTGPLLATLGASASASAAGDVVGAVTGAGEAAALLLRLGSGPPADHSGRFCRTPAGRHRFQGPPQVTARPTRV
ncbi:hypothetical protein [Streptomyces sp. AcE210]|uniref:hypothetical protein n=1 Tax=Streptomyces sp. AcE210 TaxID=2292703 RepID=UPI0019D0CF8F|nr:hypothetical protein [Streptomyces sp. AcE210]